MRVGYLGPPGTFCEEALLSLRGGDAALEEIPFPTVVDCFRAVREGEVPEALVPIENTIEGSVNQTLDQLAADGDVWIRGEVILSKKGFAQVNARFRRDLIADYIFALFIFNFNFFTDGIKLPSKIC